jgi:hypothetical protein
MAEVNPLERLGERLPLDAVVDKFPEHGRDVRAVGARLAIRHELRARSN